MHSKIIVQLLQLLAAAFVVTGAAGASGNFLKLTQAVFELNVWNNPVPERGTQFQRNFMVPENSTLFAALNVAAKKSADFSFETKYFKGLGNYIVSVNDVPEVPSKKKYWMIYKLPSSANVNSPPTKDMQTPKGIDQTRVSNRDVYLLWLQQFE